jgi:hypothetical protein
MYKYIGIVFAVLFCLMLPLPALAEGEEGADVTSAPDNIVISSVQNDNRAYKELLMDALDKTVLGNNTSVKAQLRKILFLDEVTVTADNYNRIVILVQNTINNNRLSEDAALDHYTDEDFAIAAELIDGICDELELDYSIDPSNDSQNEYARVITVTKNGKVLGKINSDAKTDVGERPSLGWIIAGGILIGGAAALGLILVLAVTKKKKAA